MVALALHNNGENESAISRIEMDNLGEALKSINISAEKLLIKEHKHNKYYIIYIKESFSFTKSETLFFDFPLDAEFLSKAR